MFSGLIASSGTAITPGSRWRFSRPENQKVASPGISVQTES
jgi:hypothetical protein